MTEAVSAGQRPLLGVSARCGNPPSEEGDGREHSDPVLGLDLPVPPDALVNFRWMPFVRQRWALPFLFLAPVILHSILGYNEFSAIQPWPGETGHWLGRAF